jgi:hypothetical protein
MKRFHVHVSVPDLAAGIDFYSVLFGQSPSVQKPDYAKWMLDDPRVNFAISARGRGVGVNHLGLQTDSDAELEVLNAQLQEADLKTHREKNVSCCYARSNKYWVTDPAGVAWETFHSLGSVPTYDGHDEVVPAMAACCDDSSAAAATATSCGAKAACCS